MHLSSDKRNLRTHNLFTEWEGRRRRGIWENRFYLQSLMECIPYKSNYHSNFFHSPSHLFPPYTHTLCSHILSILICNKNLHEQNFLPYAVFLDMPLSPFFKEFRERERKWPYKNSGIFRPHSWTIKSKFC